MIKQARKVGLALVLLAGACGGDDESGNRVTTGLPANEKLSTLDDSDAQQLCTSLADSFNNMLSDSDRKRISCTVAALPSSISVTASGEIKGDVAGCKQLVSKCMNGESVGTGEPAFEVGEEFIDASSCSDPHASEGLAGCEASVSEFESCASAMLETLSDRFAIIDCASLSDPKQLQNMSSSEDLTLEAQPACEPLSTKCPGIEFGVEG